MQIIQTKAKNHQDFFLYSIRRLNTQFDIYIQPGNHTIYFYKNIWLIV